MKALKSVSVVFLLLFCASYQLTAQNSIIVGGMVTSFKKYPLKGARVLAADSQREAVTDSAGRFSIECSPKEQVKVTAAGFKRVSFKAGKEKTVIVDLLYEDNTENFNKAVAAGHISEQVLKNAIEAERKKTKRTIQSIIPFLNLFPVRFIR